MSDLYKKYRISIYDYLGEKQCDLKNKNISLIGEIYDIEWTKNLNGYQKLKFKIPTQILHGEEYIENPRLTHIKNKQVIHLYYGDTNGNRYDGLSVTITEDSAIVTTTETLPQNIVGSFLQIDYDNYEIKSRDSDTQLTLIATLSELTTGLYSASILDDVDPKAYEKFIIDNILEEHKNNTVFYSVECPHFSYHKLSQSGIHLTFIEEIGTLQELITAIFEDSEWSVGETDVFLFEGTLTEEHKVRTMKGEKTNRYNLVQQLATLFEGYPSYDVWNKKVHFHNPEYFKDKGVDFRYRKNIVSLKRELLSENKIITKLWIEGGEYSETDSVITIANETQTHESYLLDFSWYGVDGLNVLNSTHDLAISTFKTDVAIVNENIDSALSSLSVNKDALATLKGDITGYEMGLEAKENSTGLDLSAEIAAIEAILGSVVGESGLYWDKEVLETTITADEASLDSAYADKSTVLLAFEEVMGDFILEGIWKDDSYTDSSSLYVDALSMIDKLSQLQPSYTLNIVDLSILSNYRDEDLTVGDIIHISDTELNIDNESGSISEIIRMLDNPLKTKIKISVYNAEFDDIFKKILSSTSTVSLNRELFNRTRYVSPNGLLTPESVEGAFSSGISGIGLGIDHNINITEQGLIVKSLLDDTAILVSANGLFTTVDVTTDPVVWIALAVDFDSFGVSQITAAAADGITRIVSYDNVVTLEDGDSATVDIGIDTFDSGTDTIIAMKNSVVLYQTTDYTLSDTQITKTSGTWYDDDVFYFLVFKTIATEDPTASFVTGPVGATDNAITRFDGSSGETIQDSGVIIDDSDNLTGVGTINGIDISLLGGYIHTQTVNATTWVVTHNLGKRVSTTSFNTDEELVYGDVEYVTDNQITVTYTTARTGKIYVV